MSISEISLDRLTYREYSHILQDSRTTLSIADQRIVFSFALGGIVDYDGGVSGKVLKKRPIMLVYCRNENIAQSQDFGYREILIRASVSEVSGASFFAFARLVDGISVLLREMCGEGHPPSVHRFRKIHEIQRFRRFRVILDDIHMNVYDIFCMY